MNGIGVIIGPNTKREAIEIKPHNVQVFVAEENLVTISQPVVASSTLAVTGVATFAAAPVFSAGQKQPAISGQGATRTLLASESGSVVLFDRAAGIVYTLPAPSAGMFFDFFVTVTITSNAAKVITDAGTTLLQGTILGSNSSTGAITGFFVNGTTHISVSMNGTTTGAIFGTWLRFTAVSGTLWEVEGMDQATVPATPFATS